MRRARGYGARMSENYRPGLDAHELIAVLAQLAGQQRRVEHLVCRYLADLAERFAERRRGGDAWLGELDAYANVYRAARGLLGLGVRRTRERVRVGSALRGLPAIERAFAAEELSYSQVRELTRVATQADEREWIATARSLPMRKLEQRVAAAADVRAYLGRAADRTREPAALEWRSGQVVDVRLTLRAEAWALLERAMVGARAKPSVRSNPPLTDAEAIAELARDALAHQEQAVLNDPIGSSGDRDPIGSSGRSPAEISVLGALTRRGAWYPDALADATGLGITRVHVALLQLELAAMVRRDVHGRFHGLDS